MPAEQHSIPLRKTARGEQIDTRPLYVEEWLDTLPYIDFHRSAPLLLDATRATNEQSIKASTRIELVKMYHRPYQYYIDSQIKTGARHTLHSMEKMQRQLQSLKHIAVNLSYACKLAINESLQHKGLWKQSKPPLTEMWMALNYLSHALILSFLEYAPTPKKVWRELHNIYYFAESLGQQSAVLNLPGKQQDTIASAYKRIALVALADPYHLPFGAIWRIFEQLEQWPDQAQIQPFKAVHKPVGLFVIVLNKDIPPLALSKFKDKQAKDSYRILNSTALGTHIQQHLTTLNAGQIRDEPALTSHHPDQAVLQHMIKAWGSPPQRHFLRKARQGTLQIACGVNAIYYFINGREEFVLPPEPAPDLEDTLPPVMLEDVSWELDDSPFADRQNEAAEPEAAAPWPSEESDPSTEEFEIVPTTKLELLADEQETIPSSAPWPSDESDPSTEEFQIVPTTKLELLADEQADETAKAAPIARGQQEALAKTTPSSSTLGAGMKTKPMLNYKLERWNLVDQSKGGLAITRSHRPQHQVQVGDLVAVTQGSGGDGESVDWTLGVIRWLMVRQGKVYKTGVQKLSQAPRLGAIRAPGGNEQERCYQRAFILMKPETSEVDAVIVSQGLYRQNRQMELYLEGDRLEIKAGVLLEASFGFQYFRIRK